MSDGLELNWTVSCGPGSPGRHFVHPLKLIALSEQVICQLIFKDPNPKIFDMFHAAYKLIVE